MISQAVEPQDHLALGEGLMRSIPSAVRRCRVSLLLASRCGRAPELALMTTAMDQAVTIGLCR